MNYIVSDNITCEIIQQKKHFKDVLQQSVNGMLIHPSSKKRVSISGQSEVEIVTTFPLYGSIRGKREFNKGKTLKYATPLQRYFDGKFYIPYHDDFINLDLSELTYTIEEYPTDTISNLHQALRNEENAQEQENIITQLDSIDWIDPRTKLNIT